MEVDGQVERENLPGGSAFELFEELEDDVMGDEVLQGGGEIGIGVGGVVGVVDDSS